MCKLFIVLLVIFTISLSGCDAVQTNITSHTIQEYAADSYENILVFASIGSLSEIKSIEENVVTELEKYDINAYQSVNKISPAKDYSEEEFSQRLYEVFDEYDIDGYLIISITDYWIETDHIQLPEQETAQTTAHQIGNTVYARTNYQKSGGQNIPVEHKHLSVSVNLFDTRAGEVAWMLEADSKGYALDDFDSIIGNMSGELAKQLNADL